MPLPNQYFGIIENPLKVSSFVASNGGIVPPPSGSFLLSDGSNFLLSDGTFFLLST